MIANWFSRCHLIVPADTWSEPGDAYCLSEGDWIKAQRDYRHLVSPSQLEDMQDACLANPDCIGVQHDNCQADDNDDYYYDSYYPGYYSAGDYFVCTKRSAPHDGPPTSCVSRPSTRCPNRACAAHRKCPPGYFTDKIGTVYRGPKCEKCDSLRGFFKDTFSISSMQNDSCKSVKKMQCPPGKYIRPTARAPPTCTTCQIGRYKSATSFWHRTNSDDGGDIIKDGCDRISTCPRGKYTAVASSATSNPKCKPCAPGFFKSERSWSVYGKTDSCTAARKIVCPPGTYMKESLTNYPTCEKVSILKSSTTPTSTIPSSTCLKCGTFDKSGQLSCCARGGTWFNKCGDPGDSKFDHTWFEGTQACKSKFTAY